MAVALNGIGVSELGCGCSAGVMGAGLGRPKLEGVSAENGTAEVSVAGIVAGILTVGWRVGLGLRIWFSD